VYLGKRIKYVPPKEDVISVILAANSDSQDYLWTIILTLGRVSEINRLTWQDVDFNKRTIALYTRKKKSGHLTPRIVPMPAKLYAIFNRRYERRDKRKPWVFWHRYWDRKERRWIDKPYTNRSQLMKYLCKRANVKHFGFHALRYYSSSVLDSKGEPIGAIQRILGHENRTTTEIYLHSIGDQEKQAISLGRSFLTCVALVLH
jgi:integrase